jgi:hypothetical protein
MPPDTFESCSLPYPATKTRPAKDANAVGVGTPRATTVTVRCPVACGSAGALAAAAAPFDAIAAASAAIETLSSTGFTTLVARHMQRLTIK